MSEPLLPHPGLPHKPVTPSGIIVRGMFGGQSNEEWIAKYERSHQHPVNRLCHTYGIPTILVSVAFFAAGFIRHRLWWIAVALEVTGKRDATSKASRRSSFTIGDFFSSACAGGGPRSTAKPESISPFSYSAAEGWKC